MNCHQTIVWINAEKACILRMRNGLECELTIFAATDVGHTPPEAAGSFKGSQAECPGYFHRVARALDVADEILIVGPSVTKLEFVKYMHKNDHAIDPRILGVETIAHPTDVQLAAFANLYFAEGSPRRSGNGASR